MRLLKIDADGEYDLTEDLNDQIPKYAILSHTWGSDNEEVTYKDLIEGSAKNKPGYSKLHFCGKQAANDDLQYFWVDTCCIDKSNNTELAEAINSMFRWYREAVKCYVYLTDVSKSDSNCSQESQIPWEPAFRKSRWFTRGWTLQELIAPASVEFFSIDGQRLGDRLSLERQIHEITGIPVQALRGSPLYEFTVEERMQWAAKRTTRRKEDEAYCLLGIFDIYMPLLYGEGKDHAFIRLNEEILKASKHQSIVRYKALKKRDDISSHEDNFSPIAQERKRQESIPALEFTNLDPVISNHFRVCMAVLQKMDPRKDFRVQEPLVSAQFDEAKQRLQGWAKELGISGGETSEWHDPRLQDPYLAVIIIEALKSIHKVFDPTGRITSQIRLRSDVEDRNPPDQTSYLTENAQRNQISSATSTTEEIQVHQIDEIGWSIKRRGKFTNQVDVLKSIVDTLYTLIPPMREVQGNPDWHILNPTETSRIQNDIQFLLQEARRRAKEQAQSMIEDWFDMTNFDQKYGIHQHYDKQLSSRLDETCEWIFNRPEYKSWESLDDISDESKLLWICGRAGCGKTVLCAKLVEHFKANNTSPVAFFFSSPHAASAGDPIFIIRSWITQIILVDSDAFELVRGYSEHRKGTRRASETDVWCVFDYILAERHNITLFLDGFDEYTRTDDGRTEFLKRLKQSIAGTATRILISSRDEIDIKAELSSDNNKASGQILIECMITKDDVQEDVTLYSRSVVDKRLPKKDEILREKLATKLAERCDGMFLWIKMQQEQLRSGKSGKQLEKIVENMPLGLTETYERNWKMIKSKPIMEQYRAFAILRWTMFSFRPLSISELSAALIVKPDEDGANIELEELPDDIDDEYIDGEIIDICGSLVEARTETTGAHPGTRTVHLIHSSVREFLLSVLPTWTEELSNQLQNNSQVASESDYHDYLSRVCLGYLNDDHVWDVPESENPWDKFPFLEYAARFWHSHMSYAKTDESDSFSVVNDFFDSENESFQKWGKYFETFHDEEEGRGNTAGTPLYYAALFNLLPTMEYTWSEDKSQLDTIGGQYGTPLQAACVKGNKQAFETLKKWGANPNIEGGEFGVPLNAAAAGGWKDMVVALVEGGAQLELKDSMERTGLYTAAKNGFPEIVDFLLAAGSVQKMKNKAGWTPVNSAADGGHLEVVRILLDKGGDFDDPNSGGWTPVNCAADSGHPEVIRLLLDRGANINTPNKEGCTPLHSAADNGHVETVRLLLDRGADVNTSDNYGWIPISAAARNGHLETVRLLLDRKVDVNFSPVNGYSPLNAAADSGHTEVARLLLDRGANINAQETNGWTPINSAANRSHVGLVRLLLKRGADFNIPADNGFTPLKSACYRGQIEITQLLLEHSIDINDKGKDGWTPLHISIFYGHRKISQLLLDKGADVSPFNVNGWTPLNTAAERGRIEIVQLLLDNGADINLPNSSNWSSVYVAANAGHVEILEFLLDRGADPTIRTDEGWTCLHSAAIKKRVEITQLLLDRDIIDINAQNNEGWTALHLAVSNGHLEIVQLLLDHHADIGITTKYGRTAIHSAAIRGEVATFKLLLPIEKYLSSISPTRLIEQSNSISHVAVSSEMVSKQSIVDLNALCEYWGTALHGAAHRKHLNMLQNLLETYKADVKVIDQLGRTALHIAARIGDIQCVNYLLEKGLRCSDTDNIGNTVLHYACSGSSIEVVEKVLQSDPELIRNNENWTSLHWACKTGSPELIKLLLDHGGRESIIQTAQPLSSWSPISIALYHNNANLEISNQKTLIELFDSSTSSSQEMENASNEPIMRKLGTKHGNFRCDGCLHVCKINLLDYTFC
jgi:ankyrin repeat protein